ncbi:hypothetical protein [Luteibacter sp. UNC138MFCol5.1]|uniref:hypothetical protein n=1 Tax=Luteibacter sp. UNC138MFCol5.1 TaxID=1502774 RepID=UPI001160ABEF|nr:hypothetical protein [Luteibacter sp. UNC138MFCol5.1]
MAGRTGAGHAMPFLPRPMMQGGQSLMNVKSLLLATASAFLGAAVAAVLVYRFYTVFIDEMLTSRYLAELSQDVAMYRSIRQDDRDKTSHLMRIRMAADTAGLMAQCDRLSPSEKPRVRDLFQKLNELGLDGPVIPGSDRPGPSFAGCP